MADKEKIVLAMKAVYFLAERNPRLTYGGTYISDIHSEEPEKISFWEAMDIVGKFLYEACGDLEPGS